MDQMEQGPALERWARHPLGIAVRILLSAGAIFLGGLTIVLGAFAYGFKRPADALWTDRLAESLAVGVIGVTIAIVVLVAMAKPTQRRLLAVALVLVAAPLLGRAI